MSDCVALFTRAWIEISPATASADTVTVALFTRAWIEIVAQCQAIRSCQVALFTRAWIEMMKLDTPFIDRKGRPLHEGVD